MKAFLQEYGTSLLCIIMVVMMIAISTPVGSSVSTALKGTVGDFSRMVNGDKSGDDGLMGKADGSMKEALGGSEDDDVPSAIFVGINTDNNTMYYSNNKEDLQAAGVDLDGDYFYGDISETKFYVNADGQTITEIYNTPWISQTFVEEDGTFFNTTKINILNKIKPIYGNYLFMYSQAKEIENIKNIDTSNCISMDGMFVGSQLNILDLSSFDFTNVKSSNSFIEGVENVKLIYDSNNSINKQNVDGILSNEKAILYTTNSKIKAGNNNYADRVKLITGNRYNGEYITNFIVDNFECTNDDISKDKDKFIVEFELLKSDKVTLSTDKFTVTKQQNTDDGIVYKVSTNCDDGTISKNTVVEEYDASNVYVAADFYTLYYSHSKAALRKKGIDTSDEVIGVNIEEFIDRKGVQERVKCNTYYGKENNYKSGIHGCNLNNVILLNKVHISRMARIDFLNSINYKNLNNIVITQANINNLFSEWKYNGFLDLKNIDLNDVTNVSGAFFNCYATIDVSSWDFSKFTNTTNMFASLHSSYINLGEFNISDNCETNYMFHFTSCKIYVASENAKQRVLGVLDADSYFDDESNRPTIIVGTP